MRTWCVVVLAAALLSLGLAHDGFTAGAGGEHGHDSPGHEPTAPEHCVICPALCLGGLATALGAVAFARRRRGPRVRHRVAACGALLWAWTFEHPPRFA